MTAQPQKVTPHLLLQAYAQGVFPMSESADDPEIFWVDPQMRGIFELDAFHVSRSLARRIKRGDYTYKINSCFPDVVRHCADRDETWINAEIFELYCQLHALGYAHSFEIHRENRLIGGVYGVALGGAFFGESMFSKETDASKLALYHLIKHLKSRDFTLFDTQFITPHLASLGAIEIPRSEYRNRLDQALGIKATFISAPDI
ncbi:leucyl/phenylalanyl-tRNA--protein transferase [Amylibacter kogurei]|uniref:Leucyl/phenylalanyl-tRNA--protein transferase n=1 Tax=Paramylibacter kogurei TaxID=1889778 RepID=A0A2G5K5J3_9RHOB|nr:leucyl/phenylalanyl-tRNA--protein transferase [Amylibacter kogurei]PIB24801.1 leucyl/phenylalanyl-tRNA--protein transferase [Amylibacter kogurei]